VELRPYQAQLRAGIDHAWAQGHTPLVVLPTGAGKTVVFAHVVREHRGAAVVIAHRRELVEQISLALAREAVTHRIFAPKTTIRSIVHQSTQETGRACYSPTADVAVASVDSIHKTPEIWRRRVGLWVIDEGHHVLGANKWGRAVRMFPNAKGLGVTATPERADGKGLGQIFTTLVVGPSMRDLIEAGYLSDYRVYVPPTTLDTSAIKVSQATGDFAVKAMQTAVRKAQITGDVVAHYLKWAAGKLGITFAVSIEAAGELAVAYREAGVPAEAISSKTPPAVRGELIRRFRNREILQLVNVDIFGEGFDLPAIEVVSFARPTMSFPLYAQAFGRGLRPMPDKPHAIIIDHVGNVDRHQLPDRPRVWTLADRERRAVSPPGPDAIKACRKCARVFRRYLVSCPYCGHTPEPSGRSSPEHVDGDLVELDAETLAAMRGAVERVDMPHDEYARELARRGCPEIGIRAHVKRHRGTQDAQAALRRTMEWWAGVKRNEGLSERESYKAFYLEFQIDVLSARALPTKDAATLCQRIRATLPFAAQCMTAREATTGP